MSMYQVAVFIHILSAIVWVGGLAFLALVAVPATRPLPAVERSVILQAIGRQFRLVGWVCIGLLLVTGLIVNGYRGLTWGMLFDGTLVASVFSQLLAVKVSLVAVMVLLTLVHDLWLGPASARALSRSNATPSASMRRLRRGSSWTARLSLLLALAVVFLAVALVRGLP
jgi:uncharacterized membrane protein